MIFELSKENIRLAAAEVLSLAKTDKYELIENILVCEADFDFSRLAYTNRVLQEIFVSKKVEEVDWQKYYKNNFCVRSNITSKEKPLAGIIWHSLDYPVVKLEESASEFWFYFIKEKVVCGKLVFKRKEKFNLRRPDLRPGFFPISVKPKLARALINLSGINEGKIWDPFCGTGGILLEGALVGLKVEGTDIDSEMIRAAKKNFEHYNVKGEFSIADARTKLVKCDAIVCDPPYGRRASLNKIEIQKLYEQFLANVFPNVKRVVLMMPNTLEINSEYNQVFSTEEYIHSTLTRKILVLEKSPGSS